MRYRLGCRDTGNDAQQLDHHREPTKVRKHKSFSQKVSARHYQFSDANRKRIRAGCLLYIIDSLFHVDIRSPSKGTCPEVIPLPLPCYRELWAYISDKEWEKRYQLHIATQKKRGRSGVTVGDLLLLKYSVRQSDGADNSIDGLHFTEELAEWCQKGDEFSAFLWMAFMMSS